MAQAPACSCEAISCAPCESEVGIEFYTDKCDDGVRIKSCKKPKCEPVENQKQCLALLKSPALKNAAQRGAPGPATRGPASTAEVPHFDGTIERLSGNVNLVKASGAVEIAHANQSLHDGDRLDAKSDGRALVRLRDQSELTVEANSSVTIEEVKVDEKRDTRNITLNLIRGKIRNHVQKKYEGENSFSVKTPTAVAGVRGTDFEVSFEPGEKEWISQVRTLQGLVHFEDAAPSKGDKPNRSVDVAAGTSNAFVVKSPDEGGDEMENADALNASIGLGFFTPTTSLKTEEIRRIHEATEFPSAVPDPSTKPPEKKSAVASDSLCGAPQGRFNQCSYTCEGNPKGEKHCRTNQKGVTCVRRLCRANGVWAEMTRLPANEAGQCDSPTTVVRDCGEYW